MKLLRMLVVLLTALVVALILAIPPGVASAYSDKLTQAYCASPLNGTWDGSTCTIPLGHTGTIPSGDHLYTYHDPTNGNQQISVSSGATLVVAGALSLNGGGSAGSLVNNGTVTVNPGGLIEMNWDTVAPSQSGWLQNNSGATLTNNGTLNVTAGAGATLACNYAGSFENDGTFINNVTLTNQSPCFKSTGTITNNGQYTNNGGNPTILAGTVTNNATISFNSGELTIAAGSLVNSSTGTIYLGNPGPNNLQVATLSLNPANIPFTNDGYLYINSLSSMNSSSLSYVTNTGTIESHGTFSLNYMTNETGSLFHNYGTFTVQGSYYNNIASNAGQFDNELGGTVVIRSAANPGFVNSNLLNNWGTIDNTHFGIFSNSPNAIVQNYGAFNNYDGNKVTNNGTINNYCGSTFTETYYPYVIDGNSPVNYCVAPAFTSANHTAFVIGSSGIFTVTTTGMPVPSLSKTTGTLPNSVTFTDNGNGTGTLAGTPALGTTGAYALKLTAASVSNGVPMTATQNFTLTVNRANTATTLGSSSNPSTYGQSVTLTATVAPAPDTGTVQFYADGHTFGSAVTLSSGQAMTTTAALTAATHTITATYSGNANYNPSTSSSLSQTVNKKTLTASITAANKTYDGTTTASVTPALSGIVGSDDVTVTVSAAAFADKNVGTGKTVTATGLALSGADAGNYQLAATTATTNATITARALTVSATGINKVYDGTTAATVTLSDNRLAGDSLTTNYGGASFADPNVGASKTVTVSSISVIGTDAGNYVANTTATTTANITLAPLTVTADNQSIAFGASDPPFTFHYTGFVNGETATVLTTPPTCGVGETHTAVGSYPITCSGGVDDNYAFTYVDGTLTVGLASTTTTLSSSPNPSVLGQTVTLTATVVPADATGSVQFYADGALLGPAVTLSGGSATTSTASLSVGTHFIKGIYSGDATYSGSTSDQISQPVSCPSSITATTANNSGAGSLRQALVDICPGGTITFNGDYVIRLASTLSPGKDVTIDGAGHHVTISGNDAVQVFSISAGITAQLQNLAVANAFSLSNGGAIVNHGTLTVSNSTLSANRVTNGFGGGGIYNWGATLTLINDTFVGNSATSGNGGGVASSGPMTVTNTTFSGNSADDGGAISTSGGLTMTNSTLSGNRAVFNSYAGGIRHGDKTLMIRNSIITSGSIGKNCTGAAASGSNNLANDVYCGGNFVNSTSILLGTLGDYDGGTETIPLLPGSSAIDGGDGAYCPAQDQRGKNRVSTCDIGAFESQGFTLGNLTGTPQGTPIGTAFAAPLGLTVSSSQGEPVVGGKVTFTPPAGGASAVLTGSPATVGGDGTASVTATANSTPGTYEVTASAAGVATAVQFALTNSKGNTTTTLSSSPNASVFGQTVTFTVTVSSSGLPVPTGDVTVTLGGNFWFKGTLTGGQYVGTSNLLGVGSYALVATYGGDATYTGSASAEFTQTVNKKALTASITAVNKTYDRTTTAIVTPTLTGIVGTDDVTVTVAAANFADKNVGTGKTVTATGLALSGSAKDNYIVNTTATTTASITARTLTVSATGINKVYDGTTAATVTLSDNRLPGDTLTTNYGGASFADPNVGTSKTVTVSSISVIGTDAGNYSANTTATTTANITLAPLTVTADNQSIAYGASDPPFTFHYTGFVNSETATVLTTPPTCGVSGSHAAAGTYPITCSGGVAQNYAFTYVAGTLTVLPPVTTEHYLFLPLIQRH